MEECHQRIVKLVHLPSVLGNAIPGRVAMTGAQEDEARQRRQAQSSENCGWDGMYLIKLQKRCGLTMYSEE